MSIFAGWKPSATLRSYKHTSGATVFQDARFMWVCVRVDGSRSAYVDREMSFRWALGKAAPVATPKPKPPPKPKRVLPDAKVLAVVRERGPVTMSDVVEAVGLSLSTVHTALFRLWEERRIRRELTEINGRGRRSYLWEVAA